MTGAPEAQVHSLYVIYDADGTRAGELIYMMKKLFGLAHCAACDITHGPRREKPEFVQFKVDWPVPVYNIHRDEMDEGMETAVDGEFPCVVARMPQRDVVIMQGQDLEECEGDVYVFAKRCRLCLEAHGLRLPENVGQSCKVRIGDEDGGSVSSTGDAVVPRGLF